MRERDGGDTRGGTVRVDDRAVSVTVGYVLTLAIGAVLLAGITIGIGGVLEGQTDRAVRGDLSVAGQQVVANLESADRLARAAEAGPSDPDFTGDGTASVAVHVDLPRRVAGSAYTVEVDGEAVRLRTEAPDVTVTVPHAVGEVDVAESSVRGGPLRIEYVADGSVPGNGTLEVSER